MKKIYFFTIVSLLGLCLLAFKLKEQKEERFYFIAFGDMPYFLPDDYARFENLIKTVNTLAPAFSVHVGDFKSGSTKCTDEYFTKIYNYFEQFSKPLIYTPGSYNPEERLDAVRKLFFKDDKSFGKEKFTLTTQSKNHSYSKFVENRRWNYNNVAFATLHVVGSNNNWIPEDKNLNKEFNEREAANEAWLQEVFTQAKQNSNLGLVIFIQADMFTPDKGSSGFTKLLELLKNYTVDFNKPVLLVNGDSHKFLVDKPILKDANKSLDNFTRIQVFGEYDIHAVKVVVDPSSPDLFLIEQLHIKGN